MKYLFFDLAIYTGKQYPKTLIMKGEVQYGWNDGRK